MFGLLKMQKDSGINMVSTLKDHFKFHEWLCKTHFSFQSSTSSASDLIKTMISLDYDSFCVSDFDGVYGIARSFIELKHIEDKKLKLNYAAEIHLYQDHDLPLLDQVTISIGVKSFKGYRNLNKILTRSHKDSKDEAFISLIELAKMDLEDLFVIIPMRGGLKHFLENPRDLDILQALFKDDLYLAVTKIHHRFFDSLIPKVFALSKEKKIKTLISQDVFMTHRSEKCFHDVLVAMKNNRTLSDCGEYIFPNSERSLHSKKSILETYGSFPEFTQMLENSEALANSCHFSLSEISYKYPSEMIPDGLTAQQYLEKLSWEGAKERFGAPLSAKVVDLISKELDLIEDLGFADYFITVWDIVAWARSQNILCQGRGSAANSSVCFSLGITSCDPSLFDLLFERFMSKERGDPPDIDVDFEHERREEVLQYIYRRYGRKRASMVANIITFRTKSSLREVGKVLGVPEKILKTASNTVSTVKFRGEELSSIIDYIKANTHEDVDFSWDLWSHFSQKIIGFPKHMGLHSGGFVISNDPITELVAQEPATMEGRTIIQWAKDDIEELGFFKIDCLSLGMLTAVRKSFEMIKECYGVEFDLHNIPMDDAPTYKMIQKADTIGVFQIESRAQMSMLPRLKPRSFYDLVIEIAIIRPGPIQGNVIHPFLRRRDGLEPITFPHESAKKILSKTLGVIIFQEQMMRLAIELGDFTGGEANELRKHIGSWNSKNFNRNLQPYLKKLVSGLKKRGISRQYIVSMINQMKGFAHYGFPESHAISFAFIAYASSYLKCHYPAAFYTSVMNSQPMGFYTPHALIQAAKQEGIPIFPITINDSNWDHKLEALPEVSGRPPRFGIRLGFRIIKSLGEATVSKIIKSRNKHGKWKSFDHFTHLNSLKRDEYSALAAANVFECLGLDRSNALWKSEAIPFKPMIDIEEKKISWDKNSKLFESQLDFNSTGTSLKTHPVQIIKENDWSFDVEIEKITLASKLASMEERYGVYVFGMLMIKQAPPSAKGMVFYTLQDETGMINLAFTPQKYSQYFSLLENTNFLCIRGKLQKAGEYHSILVDEVVQKNNTTTFKAAKKDQPQQTELFLHIPRGYH